MTKNYIKKIKEEIKPGELIMLDLPGVMQFCFLFEGMDQVVGKYIGADKNQIYLEGPSGEKTGYPEKYSTIEGFHHINGNSKLIQPINNLEKELKVLDLILLSFKEKLESPTIGFYECFKEGKVFINRCRKQGYEFSEAKAINLEKITNYELLERFIPDPENNGLDEILISNGTLELPEGHYKK